LFDWSRLPEGITQSRYPTAEAQRIPPYALFFVSMVHDFWMYRGDEAFVRAWDLYLAGSEVAFVTGSLQLFQVVFARAGTNAIPWTRTSA